MVSVNRAYFWLILLIGSFLINCDDYSDCGIGGGENFYDSYIIQGDVAPKHAYPWMAYLSLTDGRRIASCGGFLIDSSHVMTARHCLEITKAGGIVNIRVYLGLDNLNSLGEPHEVVEFWAADHKEQTFDDIAIVTLSKPVQFTKSIRPICLPNSNDEPFKQLIVAGFGNLATQGNSSTDLMHVLVDYIPRDICQQTIDKYEPKIIEYKVDDVSMCAINLSTGGGVCNGDSGGALMYLKGGRYFAVAIVSRGSHSCDKKYPALYTIVSRYRDTIISIAKEAQFHDY